MGQVAELRAEMRDVATRSDLHILASTKVTHGPPPVTASVPSYSSMQANIADLNDLSVEIAARPSKADAHQLVNAQIKPLVSAITGGMHVLL